MSDSVPMWPVRAATLAEVVGGRVLAGPATACFSGVSSDSRTLSREQLFVALSGEHYDGARFCASAAERGAPVVLVADRAWQEGLVEVPEGVAVVGTPDPLRALGDLAAWQRRRSGVRVVGVTGSNGKTTTKQMIAAVLGGGEQVLHNPGNLNNLIGLPLSLLRLESRHRHAVLEMGMNRPGEIARLAEIAAPQVAVVTNVHPVHLAGLGSLDNIARAKAELVTKLNETATVVLNTDDERVYAMRRLTPARCLGYGRAAGAAVRITATAPTPAGLRLELELEGGERLVINLNRPGEHNAYNVAAAVAVGLAEGVAPQLLAARLEQVSWPRWRMERLEAGGGVLLVDCYNANPRSMSAALQTLAGQSGGRARAALLGDMLELGGQERLLHRQLGEEAARKGLAALGTLGPLMAEAADAARRAGLPEVAHWQSAEAAAAWLAERLRQGMVVLVKGSRGMRLEQVVELACRRLGCPWQAGG